MKPQTPAELNIPTGFDGPVTVVQAHAHPIHDATIVEWTDHGIVILYDLPQHPTGSVAGRFSGPIRIRRFAPFATLSGISVVVSQQEEA